MDIPALQINLMMQRQDDSKEEISASHHRYLGSTPSYNSQGRASFLGKSWPLGRTPGPLTTSPTIFAQFGLVLRCPDPSACKMSK